MGALNLLRAMCTLASTWRNAPTAPDDAEAHVKRAGELREQGKLDAALGSCEHAIALKPGYALAHNSRGNILWDLQRLDEALSSYEQAISLDPGLALAHMNRANLLQSVRQFDRALAGHERAIAVAPHMAATYINRGDLLLELNRSDSALDDFNKAIALDSEHSEAHSGRGRALHTLLQYDAALESHDCAIRLAPASAEAHNQRGLLLLDMLRTQEALTNFDRAIAVNASLASAHVHRGMAYYNLQQPVAAVASYERAITLNQNSPNNTDTQIKMAMALLLNGDFKQGWACFEHRTRTPGLVQEALPYPYWQGTESLHGNVILLRSEQGLGDTLQFCRYARTLADRGASVILEVQPALKNLLKNLDGTSAVIANGEPVTQSVDYQCLLMSLPHLSGTTLDTVPAPTPYITSDEHKVGYWQHQLAAYPGLKIGLVWSGGHRADQPALWAVHHRRNIPLDMLKPLKDVKATFISLQKGEPAESELVRTLLHSNDGWEGPDIINVASELHDFTDTAAVMQNLDLIISVDTAAAHLAGALGKPVWLLNRYDTCWRWMLNRNDSPWYPTMKLYRQQTPGDWASVIQQVKADLAAW